MITHKHPHSHKDNIEETIHGIKIVDPHRWLENSEDPEVKKWINQQNKYTQKLLSSYADKKILKKELLSYLKIGWVGVTVPRGGYYFWMERKGTQNQPILYVKKGLKGKRQVLVDPNKLNKKGITTIDYWEASPQGKYVAYGLSEGGTEESTMYFLETSTGKTLKDAIPRARFSYIAWLKDENSLYYTRYPLSGTVSKGEELYHEKLYYHHLGYDHTKDPLVFGKDLPKEDMLAIALSEDNRFLAIQVNKDWTKNDLFLYDCNKKSVQPIIEDIKAKFVPTFHRGKLYILTNYQASNFKIIVADVDNIPSNIEKWQVVIPEGEFLISDFKLVSDKLIVNYLENVVAKLKVYSLNGGEQMILPLPTLGSVDAMNSEEEGNELFYYFESFFFPSAVYRYDLNTGKSELYQTVKSPINPDEFSLEQVWYESKDKTKVPMFIFHKKQTKKNKNNPFLLYAYGGFGINEAPFLVKNWLPFLEKGGVMGVANIRGGGEFGEKWHLDGILDKKQNSFNDFISAAEFLIENNYTNPQKLAILGGSNGGLLVGACITQRPDLYKAALCLVPLLDMVRFPKFVMAARWVFEYGNPDDPKDLPLILQWSPYHNVKEGVEYPSVLFGTADKDFRVDPLHARKMTALLQSVNQSNPILLRTEIDAGHGAGKPLSKVSNERVDQLAFLYWQLGIN